MKTLVLVPTYNEKENILDLVSQIFAEVPHAHVLVIDDNSPDGTAELVRTARLKEKRLFLLLRKQKQGLGRAYIAGFQWGLGLGYEAMVEMDADFSHRPVDLKEIVATLPRWDFVVGSRYVQGGATKNWGLLRRLISRGGSLYSRWILGYPLRDWTGGFNAWTAKALHAIGLDQVRSNGYSFQIELKFRALRAGLKGKEVPILFEDRRVGQSKMSLKIVIEAFYRVWGIRWL